MKNQKYVKVNISIGDLFKALGIDNDIYEDVQKVTDDIYVRNTDNVLVPIQGFVKKKVSLVKYTFDNGNELTCSNKHLVVNDLHKTVRISAQSSPLDLNQERHISSFANVEPEPILISRILSVLALM